MNSASAQSSRMFYQDLPGLPGFDQFFGQSSFSPLPEDWLVIIADIKGSTDAVKAGRYRDVNAIGVATIVAVMKATQNMAIPYVFGGDGASFCIPPDFRHDVEQSLAATQLLSQHSFGLELRAGIVPVTDVRQAGLDVLVGKYQPSIHYEQAMFTGAGLAFADRLIKRDSADNPYCLNIKFQQEHPVDEIMSGFECRWDEIPATSDEVINLLIQVVGTDSNLYKDILDTIRDVYGSGEKCSPIRADHMHLSLNSDKLGVEAKIRTGLLPWYHRFAYLIKLKLLVIIGRYLMNNNVKTSETDWGKYKSRLIENTDYQRFDDMLRLMLSGSSKQREQFVDYLDSLVKEKKIVYGLHVTTHSLVTCMISDYNHQHVHFIDGRGGGYTLAAVQLKEQLNKLKSAV